MSRKVCVVVTARPSYARIKSALKAIHDRSDLRLQLVVAGSALLDKYGRVDCVIESEGFCIDRRVHMLVEGETLVTSAKTTGLGIIELSTVFSDLRPDVVVTVADRYETIATAIAACYMHIPVAHIQGGEITGSIDEKTRHAVTKLSDLHFTATELARERVVRLGEYADRVFNTGCPSIDLAAEVATDGRLDFDPFAKYGGVGPLLQLSKGYIIVMQHPVTTEYASARQHVEETLHAVHQLGIPTLWFWPNVDAGSDETSKGIRAFREQQKPDNIHFFKNMAPSDFLKLLLNCAVVVGNSSVAIREGAFLGVPAVNIGTRQNGRERGANTVDVGYSRSEIRGAIERQLVHGRYESDPLYGRGDAGVRIAELLATVPLTTQKVLQL